MFNSTNFSSKPSAPRAWVEPSPNWVETLQDLEWMWYAHIYGFGGSFLVLALCSLVSIIVLFRRSGQSRNKTHFIVTSFLLFLLGSFRGAILFWNPYLSSGTESKAFIFACISLWGIAKACLTSAFSIMLLIFLETTRVALAPPRFQNLPFLLAVALINIVYLVLSDFVVLFYSSAKIMILICQVTFAAWGLLVCIGYLLACKRMYDNLISSKNLANQLFYAETKRLSRLKSLMQGASLLGACNFALNLYIAVSNQGVLGEIGEVDGWSWYGTRTGLRLLELGMSMFVILVGHNRRGGQNSSTPHQSNPQSLALARSLKVGASEVTVKDIQEG